MWLLAFHEKEMKSCPKSYKINSGRLHKCFDVQAGLLKTTTAMASTSGQDGFLRMANWSVVTDLGVCFFFFFLHIKQKCIFAFENEGEK